MISQRLKVTKVEDFNVSGDLRLKYPVISHLQVL